MKIIIVLFSQGCCDSLKRIQISTGSDILVHNNYSINVITPKLGGSSYSKNKF